jgi:hypothetical protein
VWTSRTKTRAAAAKRCCTTAAGNRPRAPRKKWTSLPSVTRGIGFRRICVDLIAARPVDLAIIDGIESSVGGEGPWVKGFRYANPQVLLVGRNPVCTDAVATAVMGYNPRASRGELPFRSTKPSTPDTPQYAENPMLLAEAPWVSEAPTSRASTSAAFRSKTPSTTSHPGERHRIPTLTRMSGCHRTNARTSAGPGCFCQDFSLYKLFQLNEWLGLTFRTDVVNFPNVPAFAAPNQSRVHGSFGRIGSTLDGSNNLRGDSDQPVGIGSEPTPQYEWYRYCARNGLLRVTLVLRPC